MAGETSVTTLACAARAPSYSILAVNSAPGLRRLGSANSTYLLRSMHDINLLAQARDIIRTLNTGSAIAEQIDVCLIRNANWRGRRCINLLAAEAPTSPAARRVLAAEVGTRISSGHIGVSERFVRGMKYIDELEALSIELLKKLYSSNYADHRVLTGMHGCQIAYAALAKPSDLVMTIPPYGGGDTSNRSDGPPGVRGLSVADVPFDRSECAVDLESFRVAAERLRPKVVGIGVTMALFPFPLREMKEIISPWGGLLYFDAAHHAGLIAGGAFQNPLLEGADLMTGSSGKTFSGPQGGLIAWNDRDLAERVTETIFPILTASHQVNRVASLAITATEWIDYGAEYARQIKANAKTLGAALDKRGIPVLFASKGYTETHQLMIDARPFGGGEQVACALEAVNIIVNKMPLPSDPDGSTPSGVRLGVTEITRLGMREKEMDDVAEFFAATLVRNGSKASIGRDVTDFRSPFQTVFYNHEHGLPPYTGTALAEKAA